MWEHTSGAEARSSFCLHDAGDESPAYPETMLRTVLTFFAFAEFSDYLGVFEGGGVAFDFAVGG